MFCPQVVEAVAAAHGCNATVRWLDIPYIPVVNDEKVFNLVKTVANRFSESQTWEFMPEPFMAGEDFGFLSRESLLIFIVVIYLACISST